MHNDLNFECYWIEFNFEIFVLYFKKVKYFVKKHINSKIKIKYLKYHPIPPFNILKKKKKKRA